MSSVDIIIETPRDSKEKYNYDPVTGAYHFKKALPLGMIFPHDFGFIPGTLGEDGDPLDALVISEFKSFPGCHITCRLIGAITAEQTEKGNTIRNDRFFFIPTRSLTYKHIKNIADFPKDYIQQLTSFFVNYNKALGKHFTPLKVIPARRAETLIIKGKA